MQSQTSAQTSGGVAGGDAIQELIREHETIKSLFDRLEGETGSGAMRTLEELKGILTIHNAVEENLIYPALFNVARKKTEAMKLYNETAEADVLLFEIDTMLKEGETSDFPKKVKKLHAAVIEHIEDEEHKAFKHLEENAEPQETQLLNQSVREFRSKFRISGGKGARTGEV